jgi:hypothetical protein
MVFRDEYFATKYAISDPDEIHTPLLPLVLATAGTHAGSSANRCA